MAAWADFQRARGIVLEIDDSVKSPYAWRFGLLSALAGRFVTSLPTVPGYLPPAPVRVEADKTAVLRDIAPLLHLTAPEQRSIVYQCLSEILRNVVEHANSQRGAFVCCSHYSVADRVSIAVVDTGIGVPATICRTHGKLTDKQAIEAAIQWRVTGAVNTKYFGGSAGVANNAGIGLYYVRSAATHTDGTFALASSSGFLRSDHIESVVSGDLRTPWNGTIVAIEFRPSEAAAAWKKNEELAKRLSDRKNQLVAWGPAPSNAAVATIIPTVGGFVEDKEQAIRIRESVLLPTLKAQRPVGIDLTSARVITHSFVHALLYAPIKLVGSSAKQLIYVRTNESQVRDIVRMVANYAVEDAKAESKGSGTGSTLIDKSDGEE